MEHTANPQEKKPAIKASEDDQRSWIRIVTAEIPPPSLKDNTADADRLINTLKKHLAGDRVVMDLALIRDVPQALRNSHFKVGGIVFKDGEAWRVVDVADATQPLRVFGLAVDLGTSTLVLRLLDLTTGEAVDETSFVNPQIEIGADILTRIHFAAQEGGLERLQSLLLEGLNEKIRELAGRQGQSARSIVAMSVAGNTTMTHFFLGLDPYWICREPYIPAANRQELICGKELGMEVHPRAPVLVFPNVGSYFGGDVLAGVLASEMADQKDPCILVDVGTNAEVVIGNREWLMACAGAAGPALEGGVAQIGMMAGPGAIDSVAIDPSSGKLKVTTIDGHPPVGICGSGLIDLVAELYKSGYIDLQGRLVEERCGDRFMRIGGISHFIIVPAEGSGTTGPLTLSQPDIDALMRSKAAMYTILTTITNTVNVSMHEVRHFFVAGTFGSYINPRSAITIGMLPDLPLETFVPLGNTSLLGATHALLSFEAKEKIERIRKQITYLELNVNQEFMNLFTAARFIPHTDASLFPSVRVNPI
jgi:uncharacterized 2Fe-2S/4Fe-4S cluster protein (DUF4445 family)